MIVPPQGRKQLLLQLHEGHLGISKVKSRAHSCIWWPGIDGGIEFEAMVRHCVKCQQTKGSPPEAPLYPWPWLSKPWSHLHLDFAGPINSTFILIVIDAHSN